MSPFKKQSKQTIYNNWKSIKMLLKNGKINLQFPFLLLSLPKVKVSINWHYNSFGRIYHRKQKASTTYWMMVVSIECCRFCGAAFFNILQQHFMFQHDFSISKQFPHLKWDFSYSTPKVYFVILVLSVDFFFFNFLFFWSC